MNKGKTFSSYVTLDLKKSEIIEQLLVLGLGDHIKRMSTEDSDNLTMLMAKLGMHMAEKRSDVETVDFLIKYVLCLWVRLLVDHDVDVKDLM